MSGTAGPTHKSLAKSLGVTVTTIKSYRRKFPEFWKVASLGKPIRFTPESLGLCRRIRELFRQGLGVEETRKRLTQEFEAVAGPPASRGAPAADARADALGRLEDLMQGVFGLQNRTHSLLAELMAKLDTLADRLETDRPAAPGAPALPHEPGPPRPTAGKADGHGPEERPPSALLGLPVVVRSDTGEFLGVTSPAGRPFTLSQFEEFLAARQENGPAVRRWIRDGQEWTLRLMRGGKAHDHHFLQAVTPRGNAVARFASLSVDGVRASEAALQAFLRQVKDSFAA